jgi:DNA-binding transcriptional MerR regulator
MNRFHGKKKELQKLELRSKLYTISDVARMLNVHPEELHREIYLRERLPSPTRKLGVLQRRYYNEGDVRAIFKLVKY